jgi:hypothetical protein
MLGRPAQAMAGRAGTRAGAAADIDPPAAGRILDGRLAAAGGSGLGNGAGGRESVSITIVDSDCLGRSTWAVVLTAIQTISAFSAITSTNMPTRGPRRSPCQARTASAAASAFERSSVIASLRTPQWCDRTKPRSHASNAEIRLSLKPDRVSLEAAQK